MFKKIKACVAAVPAVIGALALVASVSAHAALPAGVATFLTGLTTDFGDLEDLLYPVMLAVTGAFIIMGLVKKGAKKAAS